MHMRLWLFLIPLLAALAPLPAVTADKPARTPGVPKVSWKKIVVDRAFRSEGVAVADVNKDGKPDILVGDVWYEAPDWKVHRIRVGKIFKDDYRDGDKNVYSQSFACWADDLNGDGWPDLIVIGFPGMPCHWYENPQNKEGPWKAHVICESACNETPQYVDLFGTGNRVLVMGFLEKQMVWVAPNSDATKPWVVHPISDPKIKAPRTARYAHGLGAGDINGDKRLDVICTEGWWEQPATVSDQPWKFHPASLGPDCADMFAYDLDGDGKADVVSSSAHNYGIWWHQQQPSKDDNPTFIRRDLFPKLFSQSHALHCVDINGDGLKDLVTGRRFWAHGPKGDVGAGDPAYLYWFQAKRNKDGSIRFEPHQIDDDSGIGTQFAIADLNGDGLPDIIISNKKGVFAFLQVRAEATKE